MGTILYRRPKDYGDHKGLVKVLMMMKYNIMHTCVHEEEPICSVDCVKHIIEEVDEIHEELCDISEELPCLVGLHRGHVLSHTEETLDYMAHILDSLHEELRHLKLPQTLPASTANVTIDPTIHHHHIKQALHKACLHLKEEYKDLVEDMHKLYLISDSTRHVLERGL